MRQREPIRFDADEKHFPQEFHGPEGGGIGTSAIGVLRNAADDGVAEIEAELRIGRVSEKDGADVEKVGGGERNEFGKEELVVERERRCFNGDGMELLELSYGFAGIEAVLEKMEFLGIHARIWYG